MQKFTAKRTGEVSLKIEFYGQGNAELRYNSYPNEPQVAIAKRKFLYWD
ncbi:MAG: hypothetical protein LRY27_01255 [Chitinophagales bacterium]|nr:hypothetical protein [Chitinophagales bacterium]